MYNETFRNSNKCQHSQTYKGIFKKNLIVFIDTGNFNASVWEV